LYIISKGLGDTLPIRYNCRKDMIFVRVGPLRHGDLDKGGDLLGGLDVVSDF